MEKTSKYSAEIKTEVLEICETFGLGSFQELLTIDETKVSQGYIFVQFDTNMGRYNHYYRVDNNWYRDSPESDSDSGTLLWVHGYDL